MDFFWQGRMRTGEDKGRQFAKGQCIWTWWLSGSSIFHSCHVLTAQDRHDCGRSPCKGTHFSFWVSKFTLAFMSWLLH